MPPKLVGVTTATFLCLSAVNKEHGCQQFNPFAVVGFYLKEIIATGDVLVIENFKLSMECNVAVN